MYGYLAVRYGLMALLNRGALPRAAHFAPMGGEWKTASLVYQAANVLFPLLLCFLPLRFAGFPGAAGLVLFMTGLALLIASVVSFARAVPDGLATQGPYRLIRNPMYLAYFLYYLGCAVPARSIPLLVLLVVFQAGAHFPILAEERWCLDRFGAQCVAYMEKAGRYLPRLRRGVR